MATLIAADITRPEDRDAHEARIIEANRRLAELRIIRIDYRGLPDGLRKFVDSIKQERNHD